MALYDPFVSFDDMLDFDIFMAPGAVPGGGPGPRGEAPGTYGSSFATKNVLA